MDLSCKRCGVSIPARDVNLERMVAKCVTCDAVFAFEDQLRAGSRSEPSALAKAPVALPEGWVLVEDAQAPFGGAGYRDAARGGPPSLSVRWRWFRARHLGMLGFALVWCSFLVFWYSSVTASGAPWIFFVFPLIHVAVGVGMLYAALAGLLNRTTLTVRDGTIAIAHAPLPWRGARTLDVREIKQLYCIEERKKSKNGTTTSYTVKVQRRGGDEIALVKDLDDRAQALYIEHKVEHALGIEDVPVVGELPK
ncbi:MAG: hypothetical protein RIF41_09870 [Polyangiaceae bacterium]